MDLRKIIRETLEEHLDKSLILKEEVEISDALRYHVENGLTWKRRNTEVKMLNWVNHSEHREVLRNLRFMLNHQVEMLKK